MRIRPLGLLAVVASLAALAAPTATPAAPRGTSADRGVVQSIDAQHIVLKALDGSSVAFTLVPGTRVRLNGAAATVFDVLPGFVAEVLSDRRHRAILIRVLSSAGAAITTDRSTVIAVTKTSITIVPERGGSAATIPIDRNTKVRLPGAITRKGLLRPGLVVTVTHAPDGPALVITILKRAGA